VFLGVILGVKKELFLTLSGETSKKGQKRVFLDPLDLLQSTPGVFLTFLVLL